MMNPIIISILVILIHVHIGFLLSLIKKRNDVADILWGIGFILISISLYIFGYRNLNFLIISIMVFIWGLRLSIHVYSRNKNKKEDYRYIEMKEKWGKNFYINSYIQVFLIQGILSLIIASPVYLSALISPSFRSTTILGIILWIIGFIFESVGDHQLNLFLKNPENKGRIMQSGLWKFTRHPNYFGEISQWWGLFLVCISAPLGFLSIISPLTITYLLLYVSGIPLLEKRYEGNPEYEEYKRKTSVLIPLFPRK